MKQTTNTIFMVEPIEFAFNEETAGNNHFQKQLAQSKEEIQKQALQEFQEMVDLLRKNSIEVITIKDTKEPKTPDSIFPNNWISFHKNGTVGLYPMFAVNRRKERREDVLKLIEEKGFSIKNIVDYTSAENESIFLEGTGSMVLDRSTKIAFAAISERTHEDLLLEFCEDFDYQPVYFTANQNFEDKRTPIYHTNVMMCVGEEFVVICLETIDDEVERQYVTEQIKKSGKEIIEITEQQMNHFAGNMLQVHDTNSNPILLMSKNAYDSLSQEQAKTLEKYNPILFFDINTIETLGGGSVRCMMAEVFLPKHAG